jgi:alkylhydroperoxidase family enzyme
MTEPTVDNTDSAQVQPSASTAAARPTPLANVRTYFPELARAVDSYNPFLSSVIGPGLTELCRVRIAQILCSPEEILAVSTGALDAGVSQAQLDAVSNWLESDVFDDTQKACLELAEYFCYSAESITDEQVAGVSEHLSAEQVFALTIALWMSDVHHRMSNFLQILSPKESIA